MGVVQCTVDSIRVGAVFPDQLTLILKRKHTDAYVLFLSEHQGTMLADELHGRRDSNRELEAFSKRSNSIDSDIGSASFLGGSFFAKVLLSPDRRPHEVRCPIGVALALAVRSGAPIFIDERVFEYVGARLSADLCS